MVRHDDQMRAFYDIELPTRAGLAAGSPRRLRLERFVAACVTERLHSVLEVGSGAGHDGSLIRAAGLGYTGVDLSAVGAALCRARGLDAVQASATALPFKDGSFDAGWTMSTLMHLPGDDIEQALRELRRVIRPGGLIDVGVWGADTDGTRIDDQGRYFRHLTDLHLQELVVKIGDLQAFETWDYLPGGGHYQWARVVVTSP
jgi:SAM-dependent methyltransferase